MFASVIRCIVATTVELGNDEVYYRIYATDIQWNYFDHPPMVAWLIRTTTINLYFDTEFFIRLGAILSAAVTTWLFYLSGKKIGTAQTGFYAAAIYTATLYGSIIAGTFILPDSPQMVCWAGSLYLLIFITDSKSIGKTKKRKLVLFGLVTGLGMLCKIHTSFLWLGFLLYIFLYNPKWFRQPVLYLSGFITLVFFYPVIKWNIDNQFITFLFHSSRVNIANSGFDISNFLGFAGGQVLYYNPVIFIFIVISVIAAFKNQLPINIQQKRLLLWTSLPLIIIATLISFFKPVLPHWTGPAYSSLILLTACYFGKRKNNGQAEKRLLPIPLLIANGFLILVIAAGLTVINFFPGTIGKKSGIQTGDGDFTLDMYGWQKLKTEFKRVYRQDTSSRSIQPGAFIICNKWFSAAHLDYYIARPLAIDLIALGEIYDIHQYAWLNKTRRVMLKDDDAYCIVPSNNFFDPKSVYASSFENISAVSTITQKRNGTICRYFYIYRLSKFKGN